MPEKGTGMNQFAVLLKRGVWLPPVMLSAVLMLASYYNYLLFHTLAELFSIIVGVLMFVVAAYAHKYARDNFIMYLATGYFWVASMDLIHTLIYKGMGIYPVTIANYSTQFWIANRYVEALLLLTAPLFFTRWTHQSPSLLFSA
ncbi:MASE3 domain-containing protein [Mariprofundus ferrooxydans]|uniref:MASE3 domain-containing protein n=1 Tax=Mariprofundus ferrooxydans TaxID=314344 RepID=UPI0023ED1EA7|nr:MASE3 domain-containing protein [Mariprofundus ferrooxydans]